MDKHTALQVIVTARDALRDAGFRTQADADHMIIQTPDHSSGNTLLVTLTDTPELPYQMSYFWRGEEDAAETVDVSLETLLECASEFL